MESERRERRGRGRGREGGDARAARTHIHTNTHKHIDRSLSWMGQDVENGAVSRRAEVLQSEKRKLEKERIDTEQYTVRPWISTFCPSVSTTFCT